MPIRNAKSHIAAALDTRPTRAIAEIQRWFRVQSVCTRLAAVCFFGGTALAYLCQRWDDATGRTWSLAGIVAGIAALLYVLVAIFLFGSLWRTQRLAKKTPWLGDAAEARALIRALVNCGGYRNATLVDLLLKALPSVQPDGEQALDTQSHILARQILARPPDSLLHADVLHIDGEPAPRDVELRIALLELMARTGNAEDLKVVRRWAEDRDKSRSHLAISRAAQTVLPRLEARVAELTASSTLVRASGVSPDAGALLRPAAGADTPEQQLLRGSQEP